ncbi:MAG: hypothetical protein Q9217_003476 [Psora testacea]
MDSESHNWKSNLQPRANSEKLEVPVPQASESPHHNAKQNPSQRVQRSNRVNEEGRLPSLHHTRPVVNQSSTTPNRTANVQPVANVASMTDLEGQMRSMILNTQGADRSQPSRGTDGSAKIPQQSKQVQNRPLRRANQAEGRQRNAEAEQLTANIGRDESRTQAYSSPHQSRSQFGQYSTNVAPHQHHGHIFEAENPVQWPSRSPLSQNRQLFNLNNEGQQKGPRLEHSYRGGLGNQFFVADIRDQIDYVDSYARNEVMRVEISPEEYETKQALRMTLEDICRRTVSEFESQRIHNFPAQSVELKCFGSLSTTFATKGSDMDLVLLSPHSAPDASSNDSALPRLIEKALLERGYGARLLTRTRVPIIKFCQEPNPELAQRLRAARSRWEEEREVPAVAEEKAARKLKKKTEIDADDGSNPKLLHNRIPSGGEDVSFGKDFLGIRELPAVSADITEESQQLTPANENKSAEQAPRVPVMPATKGLEGEDPSLESKTDEERARLYRLAIKEEWYEPEERAIIFDFIQALEISGDETILEKAREKLKTLPNVLKRYRLPPEKHLDFPKDGIGIQCDINFSNHLALHNSVLLRCYSICNSRVRPMVLFVKVWAKKRKINSAYESTLSSYGYVLMVLHYLVNVASPPVVPNLQHYPRIQRDELSSKTVEVNGYNVQFFRNENILRKLAATGQLTSNQESLGSLIRGFFQYFGSNGLNSFHWMREVLSLRTLGGILTKQSKGWVAAKTETIDAGPGSHETKDIRQRYLIAIEDPFETHHNVGRTVSHDGIVAIRNEFRRAHGLIQSAGTAHNGQQHLLEEAESRGNLQYRFFGPRPRRGNRKANGDTNEAKDTAKRDGKMSSGASHNAAASRDAVLNSLQQLLH